MNKLKPQHEDYNLVLVAWKMLSNWLIMTVSSSASCHMPAYKAAIYIYNLEPLNLVADLSHEIQSQHCQTVSKNSA